MWTDNLKHFHFWCQKVLPLVYDDSLSYYEVLCKVTDHLNRLTTLVNEIGDELERYEGVTDTRLDNLETWRAEVDTWRANIDIWQGQINSWKSAIDSWKDDIDDWKTTVSNWITNTVTPFITNMTERVEDIEATLSALVNTVQFQAERSMKIIPVTLHYDTSNNQFYLQEVISFISGGRYPFEDYLSSSSLDTDATTNGSNLVFSIRDFYVDASTVDHQFPPGSMTTATSKTVKIKKATLYGGGYVQYNGHDVYFELDTQDIQTIYDPMDFFSPLLMYAPKSNTDSRPHRIVWIPRDQFIYGTAERIGVVEQREVALDRSKSIVVRGDLVYDSSNDRLTFRLEANTNFPSEYISNVNVALCPYMQNIIYAISVGDDAHKLNTDYVALEDFNYKVYIVNNQGSSYVYENQDVYFSAVESRIVGTTHILAVPSGYANLLLYNLPTLVEEKVGYNNKYPSLKIGNNLSVRKSGSEYFLDATGGSSGGHSYSTTEKIVGTWIDGSPIYQKTIQIENPTAGVVNWYNHNIPDISYVVTFLVHIIETSGSGSTTFTMFKPLVGNTGPTSVDGAYSISVDSVTSTAIRYMVGNSYPISDCSIYVTIQYTKTTD